MVLSLYLFTPAAACLFWVIIHMVMASRTDTFHIFITLFAACGLYIYSESCHSVLEYGSAMDVAATLTGMLAGPCIIPLLITYLRRLMHIPRSHPVTFTWVVIPAALFTAGTLLSILRGEEAERLFRLITEDVYRAILAAGLLYLLIFIITMLAQRRMLVGTMLKFFRGERISLARLQMSTAMIPITLMALRVGSGVNLYGLGKAGDGRSGGGGCHPCDAAHRQGAHPERPAGRG